MAFIIHKKLSLSKARTCIGIFIFTYTCWIKSVWTLYLYYFSHFSHGTLFARSKPDLPACIYRQNVSWHDSTSYLIILNAMFQDNHSLLLREQSLCYYLLHNPDWWQFCLSQANLRIQGNGLRKLLAKFFRGQKLADFVKHCEAQEFIIS